MNKQEFYFCEICNTGFPTPEQAIDCESSHILAKDICFIYESRTLKPSGVKVSFADGTEAIYFINHGDK